MTITLLDPSLVLLIGPSGSGKSTFARRTFRTTEVLSSDLCRALVCDDESEQAATNDAFEVLHLILHKRLQRRRLTVIDATNVQVSAREPLLAAAKTFNVPLFAIVFALPEQICQIRNQQRASRQVTVAVIQEQLATLATSIDQLETGFHAVFRLESVEDAEAATIVREPHY